MMLRAERPGDAAAIEAVTVAAFADHPHSNQTEHIIVARLRAENALTLSLVAQEGAGVVGHIAFSPVSIDDGTADWYGLGPVSVAPEAQGKGIGSALIREGLQRLAAAGAKGCVVMGDPEFYKKFGFRNEEGVVFPGCAPQYFLALALSGPMACGNVRYHEAFDC